jgi:hypothetical protein
MSKVKSLSGVPVLDDFKGSKGTPLVINIATGKGYYLAGSDVISELSRHGSGVNETLFDSTGHQTMTGTARPWRDALTDALNIKNTGVGVSTNAAESTVEFVNNALAASDYLYLNIQMNHDKDPTSSIYPHIHFFQGRNAIPNFLLYYRWQKMGAEKATSWVPLKCTTLAFTYGGTTRVNIASSVAIAPPTGTGLSDIVQFRICRDTNNASGLFTGADPYTGTVGVLAFDIHFQINSLGSTDEYTK